MPAVTRVGDIGVCPIPPHGPNPMATGSPNVFVNNIPCHRVDTFWSCGAATKNASPNVYVNNQPIARIGDVSDHGGVIIEGSPNVFAND